MAKPEDYEALRSTLVDDIAKTADPSVVDRLNDLLLALEHCALNPAKPKGSQITYASVNTNHDVSRLTMVNAVAVISMLIVTVVALAVHR